MPDRKKYIKLLSSLTLLLLIIIISAMSVGRYSMNPVDTIRAIVTKALGIEGNEIMESVVFYVRIPRVLGALFIGMALAVSGAVYQSAFKNPLVSPDLLGVSSGASTGAALAIILSVGTQGTQFFAFCGGMLAVALATSLPKMLKNSSNMMLILSGIIVSGFMTSLLGVIKFFAEEQTELSSIVFWQMGSLSTITYGQLLTVVPIMIVCLIIMVAISWQLNILSFGEQEAKSIGVNVKLLRGIAIVCASLLTASAVCISGTIGWIGLVIPHFGRMIAGSDNTKMLPVTMVLGASFLLIIDTFARALTTLEIPLSILSGLVGAPFYAWLLYRQKAKIL
ncbi:MAG: iron ABC transporter permease [Eubacteriales bacterium]